MSANAKTTVAIDYLMRILATRNACPAVSLLTFLSITLSPAHLWALTEDQLIFVKDSALELCRGGTLQGEASTYRIEGSGEATIFIIKKLVEIGVDGEIELTGAEWEGIKAVIPEHWDAAAWNECVASTLEFFADKLEGDNASSEDREFHGYLKYRPPQRYIGFGSYILAPRDRVQLPDPEVSEDERHSAISSTSDFPPIGYCLLKVVGAADSGVASARHNYVRLTCWGGTAQHQAMADGTWFIDRAGVLVNSKLLDIDSVAYRVDIFPYQPKYVNIPDKVRPGDAFSTFKVSSIGVDTLYGDDRDMPRAIIYEGELGGYVAEGRRYDGEDAYVLVQEIGKDGLGHFAQIEVQRR